MYILTKNDEKKNFSLRQLCDTALAIQIKIKIGSFFYLNINRCGFCATSATSVFNSNLYKQRWLAKLKQIIKEGIKIQFTVKKITPLLGLIRSVYKNG